MENSPKVRKDNSLYYIIAVIFGVLTAWVITHSFGYVLLGVVLALLTAGFFVNVLVEKREL